MDAASQGDSARKRRAVRQRLESLAAAGVKQLPKAKRRAAVAKPSQPATAATVPGKPSVAAARPSTPATPAANDVAAQLAVIQREVAACTRCSHLAQTRTQTVFGVGNLRPRLVFVGEAPGADEDRQGEPFVGRAGQLLTKIIEASKMRREDVYICNVLKCRPPDNRTPEPPEIANCRGFLDRQLSALKPEFICCLGATAARTLLETEASIGKLRKQFWSYRGTPVLCTYHPSYLLRNPPAKKDVWEDMQLLMAKMGIEVG